MSPPITRAIMLAPAGFCHPNSSAVGTLLDMLIAGAPHGDVAARAQQLLDPGTYQRPQAAPKAGTIDAAEKLVQKMGIERSLERRHASMVDIPPRAVRWAPPPKQPAVGVFSSLRPAPQANPWATSSNTKTMSWTRFARDVLPKAERIEALVPSHGPFFSLMTAARLDAPPILKWDSEAERNPVSWYVYLKGSLAASFDVRANHWTDVDYVLRRPDTWSSTYAGNDPAVLFVLRAARDTINPGLALFPEILKSELHGVRSVIEAHSNRGAAARSPLKQVAGLMYDMSRETWGLSLRVTMGSMQVHVTLDRGE